ncbi:hypothetical protein MKX01_009931 [Papaver californicum]|nr:hypothetical protein MKX01_009931 [Papaver californicum]
MLRRRLPSLLATSIHQSSQVYKNPNFISTKTISSSTLSFQSQQSLDSKIYPNNNVSLSHGIRVYSSLLALNDLADNKGSNKKRTRKGRGIGSGKGKTGGRGHKGQRARGSHKAGFEGGQTPLLGLGKIAKLVNAGKIDSSELITMKTLKDSAAIGKQIRDGVRLMGRGAEQIKWPIHLEVSRVTVRAKEAVEAAGGSVRKVYYNKLGFRALLKPEWFEKKGRLLPKAARPPPKQKDKVDSVGRLPAPTKPILFTQEEIAAASTPSDA